MLRTLAISLLACTSVLAGEIVVPDDAVNLDTAIAMSQPGDTILVRTQAPQGGSQLITHPLTIIGDTVCHIRLNSDEAAFQLAGPGAGEVVLANLDITYWSGDSNGGRMIFGTGFDALTIVGSSVVHNNTSPSGQVTQVHPAVELAAVARLNVINSTLVGGTAGGDECVVEPDENHLNGRAGIEAPDTEVLLVESVVRGGNGGGLTETSYSPCTPNIAEWNGEGGDGVIAKSLFAYESTVSAGQGVFWQWDDIGFCLGFAPCGQAADGTAVVLSGTHLDAPCARLGLGATIGQPGEAVPQVGGSVTFQWDGGATPCWPALSSCAPNCVGLFFMELKHPVDAVPFLGTWIHLDPSVAQLIQSFPAHATSAWSYPVPNLPALVGAEWSAQAYVSNGELSNPVFGTLR